MARISGVDLPKEKRIETALGYIYGIGPSLAKRIVTSANVAPEIRVKNLTEDEVHRIQNVINQEYKVEGDLRREVNQNIKRLIDIGCYRGVRHRRGLPVRGQRTRTNARTRKGPRKTVGSSKKPVEKK
jgi:small subunit ribosomal protein S13